MKASEILTKAAEWLRDHEWCQGEYAQDEDGAALPLDHDELPPPPNAYACCAVGAMCAAAQAGEPDPDVRDAISWMKLQIGEVNVADWNDANGRTKDEVIAALRAAAATAKLNEP